jgi:hypothetical protein
MTSRASVRAGWADARDDVDAVATLLVARQWPQLDRAAMVLGRNTLDLGIAAAALPADVSRRVDGAVGALLRVSDLAARAAALAPVDADEVAAALALIEGETARAERLWATVESALGRSRRAHLRAV